MHNIRISKCTIFTVMSILLYVDVNETEMFTWMEIHKPITIIYVHLWVIIIFWGINFLSDNESIVCCYKHSFPQRRFILMMFRDACRFRIHSPLAFTFITDRIFRNLWTLYLPFVDHSSTKLASYDCHSWILRHYSLVFIFRIQSS